MQQITIGKNEAGQRFDKFLVKYLPDAPKSIIYKMLRKKNITLNKKKADGSEKLIEGDTVESFFSDETFIKFTASNTSNINTNKSIRFPKINPQIVYEDDDIILVNKPAGILSQKSVPQDYSINEWLIDYLRENGCITAEELKTFKPSICNRLDRNTSGIVVCGKSLHGLQVMTELIREKKLQKYYMTICHGTIDKDFRAEGIIIKDSSRNISKVINNSEKDSNIITDFKVIEKYKNATLLEVNLHTGKSHQIRAQLSSLDHPIIGDKKYGSNEYNSNEYNTNEHSSNEFKVSQVEQRLKYQLLTAYKLCFPSKDSLPEDMYHLADREFTIELPADFAKIINILEK